MSAFLFPSSIPGQAFDFVFEHHRLLMSMDAAAELANVMQREKFDRFLSRRRREELVVGAIRVSEFVATPSIIAKCRDSKDDKFLALAVDGGAAAIVTGDSDMLVLNPFDGIPILSPRDFLAQFATT